MPIRLVFLGHSRVRMLQREFQAEHIKEAIRNPDYQDVQSGGAVKVRKLLKGSRTITVVYRRDRFRRDSRFFIITVYYTIMDIQYDTEADALYVTLAKGKISRTVEISEYGIADLDQSERILGLEMLDVSINPVAQSVLAGNPIHELPFAIAE